MIVETFTVGMLQCNCTIVGDEQTREACAGVELGVIHTPGHTPGSTCFLLQGERNTLFAGDTLFNNGIGRTDLWRGSTPEILSSIKNKLMTLDEDTLVIAGHGPSTTVGRERRGNPFLK